MSTFELGQKVIIRSLHRGPDHEGEVVKIGRTLVTVKELSRYSREIVCRMDTGVENHRDFPGVKILTHEQDAEEKARAAQMDRLRENGLEVISYGRYRARDSFDSTLLAGINDMIEEYRA